MSSNTRAEKKLTDSVERAIAETTQHVTDEMNSKINELQQDQALALQAKDREIKAQAAKIHDLEQQQASQPRGKRGREVIPQKTPEEDRQELVMDIITHIMPQGEDEEFSIPDPDAPPRPKGTSKDVPEARISVDITAAVQRHPVVTDGSEEQNAGIRKKLFHLFWAALAKFELPRKPNNKYKVAASMFANMFEETKEMHTTEDFVERFEKYQKLFKSARRIAVFHLKDVGAIKAFIFNKLDEPFQEPPSYQEPPSKKQCLGGDDGVLSDPPTPGRV